MKAFKLVSLLFLAILPCVCSADPIVFAGVLYAWTAHTIGVSAYKAFPSISDADAFFAGMGVVTEIDYGETRKFILSKGYMVSGWPLGGTSTYSSSQVGLQIIQATGTMKYLWVFNGFEWVYLVPVTYYYDVAKYGSVLTGHADDVTSLTTADGNVTGVTYTSDTGESIALDSFGKEVVQKAQSPAFTNSAPVYSANLDGYFKDLSVSLKAVGQTVEALPHADYSSLLSDIDASVKSLAASSSSGSGGASSAPDLSTLNNGVSAIVAGGTPALPSSDSSVSDADFSEADVEIASSAVWKLGFDNILCNTLGSGLTAFFGTLPNIGMSDTLLLWDSPNLPLVGVVHVDVNTTKYFWIIYFRATCLLALLIWFSFAAFKIIRGALI